MDAIEQALRRVARPGRYAGGEYGSAAGARVHGAYRVAVSYPDLYEIGMSNLAVRILYDRINALEGVVCERVFAVDVDLERELRACGLKLFTLESRTPLSDLDLIGFSLGYEMTLTNMLAILDLGGVSLDAAERGDGEPIVIAGGPVASNPLPLARFVDCAFIGEAEEWVSGALPAVAAMKRSGASRGQMLEALLDHPSMWGPTKNRARRAVWAGFGVAAQSSALPVASLKIVQDHGNVEIMRGCPNGCRFCHAGMISRPMRIKEPGDIEAEVDRLIREAGHREVTLASLSSADYPGLPALLRRLNDRYAGRGISFSVPSLRVESVGLDMFAELSAVRRSGLTFAVETPGRLRQRGLNKEVPADRTIEILREARARGWRSAKFYFMVGLPLPDSEREAGEIIELLERTGGESGMFLNVNVATFIPKPHTPFQWAAQLGEEEALARIMEVRRALPKRRFKVGYHAPFTSVLEGIVSRGDERVGDLVLAAYRAGARLDAWEERIRWDLWREAIGSAGWDVLGESLRSRGLDEALPWDVVDSGISPRFLRDEWLRAQRGELTSPCEPDCRTPCGACSRSLRVRRVASSVGRGVEAAPATAGSRARVLLAFSKQGRGALISHLDLMGVMEKAFVRAGFLVSFTEGHNPKPRLEFASPLALGVESAAEVAAVDLLNFAGEADFVARMNAALPAGLAVRRAAELAAGDRRSLAARFWGADYEVACDRAGELAAALEAQVRAEGPLVAVEADGGRLRIRHRQLQKKGTSLLDLLAGALQAPPLAEGVIVRRLGLLCADGSDLFAAVSLRS